VPLILTDTTVLNNFAQVERPDLLRRAFPSLAAPTIVREELATGERLGLVAACDWSWLQLIELTAAEQSRVAELKRRLQAGEAACIAVAEARGGRLFLTDDSSARGLAKSLNLEISGTLGALIRLVRQGTLTLSQGDALLAEMRRRGYRSPLQSLHESR
jgi:predicted nucleic acid-binding protein